MKESTFLILLIVSSGVSRALNSNELAIVEDEEKPEWVLNEMEDFSKGKSNFVATNEWQIVEDDQMVPAGLHIRMNMQTGLKEAKLIEQPHNNNNNKNYKNNNERTRKPTAGGSLEGVMQEAIEDAMMQLKKEGQGRVEGADEGGVEGAGLPRQINMSMEAIKRSLHKLNTPPQETDQDADIQTDKDTDKKTDSKLRFRSIEELRKEFKEMDMAIKSDQEIVAEYVKRLQRLQLQWLTLRGQGSGVEEESAGVEEEKVNLLKNLEYYMHQIDNAVVLTDLGGLEVIWKEVEEGGARRDEVARWVMLNIAAISQSNPHSQVAVAKTSILQGILKIIINTNSSSPFPPLKLASLSALSAVIRNFPLAQEVVASDGGFAAICHVITQHLNHLEGHQVENNNNNNENNNIENNNKNKNNPIADDSSSNEQEERKRFVKFSRKFVNLVTDIWEEKVLNEQDDQISNELRQSKSLQYERVGLLEQLTSCGWCHLIGQLFSSVTDLDYREEMLNSMVAFKHLCPLYESSVYVHLRRFKSELQGLMEDNDGDVFFRHLHSSVDSLLNRTHVDL